MRRVNVDIFQKVYIFVCVCARACVYLSIFIYVDMDRFG